ncbi:MAG: hypothetical protein RL701_1265 [Pseudomonadota bacterium]
MKYVDAVWFYTERTRTAIADVWQDAMPKAVAEVRALADKGRHVMDDVKHAVSKLPAWPRLRAHTQELGRKGRVASGPAKLVSGA